MTLIASALAGGDCIDDADALRAGRTSSVLGCTVKAPSTPTFARAGCGDVPPQLPVGPCPPAGPGEPGTAGPGLASLWAVAVMALGPPICAFFRRRKAVQGAVGAVQGVGGETQGRRRTVGAGLGLGAHDLAAGDAVVWAQPQPGREVLRTRPFGHVGANFTHHLERGAGIHTVDLGQVNPRHTVQVRPNVEARGVSFAAFSVRTSPPEDHHCCGPQSAPAGLQSPGRTRQSYPGRTGTVPGPGSARRCAPPASGPATTWRWSPRRP